MTVSDLKNYRAVFRPPISTDYRGYTVISFPPPSSGGVHLLEILNMLETRQFSDPHFTESDRIHFTAEAMKLTFADRAFWLGDPDFVNVPRGLINKDYARTLAEKIDMAHVIDVPSHGTPADIEPFSRHTTHLSTADAEGNWVALTATINTRFGSKVVVPGTGVMLLNNEIWTTLFFSATRREQLFRPHRRRSKCTPPELGGGNEITVHPRYSVEIAER